MTVLTKKIDASIVPFTSVMTGSPFSILKVESIDKRTLICRCTASEQKFKVHHNVKGWKIQTNDFLLIQRKGIGSNFETAKIMDCSQENTWKEGVNYTPTINSSVFTFELHEELAEA